MKYTLIDRSRNMNEASRKMTIQKNVTGENIVFLEIAINDGPKGLKRGLFTYKNKGKMKTITFIVIESEELIIQLGFFGWKEGTRKSLNNLLGRTGFSREDKTLFFLMNLMIFHSLLRLYQLQKFVYGVKRKILGFCSFEILHIKLLQLLENGRFIELVFLHDLNQCVGIDIIYTIIESIRSILVSSGRVVEALRRTAKKRN